MKDVFRKPLTDKSTLWVSPKDYIDEIRGHTKPTTINSTQIYSKIDENLSKSYFYSSLFCVPERRSNFIIEQISYCLLIRVKIRHKFVCHISDFKYSCFPIKQACSSHSFLVIFQHAGSFFTTL